MRRNVSTRAAWRAGSIAAVLGGVFLLLQRVGGSPEAEPAPQMPAVGQGPAPALLEGAAPRATAADFAPLPRVPAQAMTQGRWEPQGAAPLAGGAAQIPQSLVVGAVQELAPHPTNADILYAGTVNGGIWKTENATAVSPSWRPLTDDMPSLSIGALELDPANPDVLVAGIGRFSSFGRRGGPLAGLMRSADAGATWKALDAAVVRGQNISGIASRGAVIVASSSSQNGGVFRSTDTGASFTALSTVPASGLPAGTAQDLVGDPTNPARLYVGFLRVGVFRSDDMGATWTSISDADTSGLKDEILAQAMNNDGRTNLEFSVAANGRLYVAVSRMGGPRYIGFSDNEGRSFTRMDVPVFPAGQNGTEGVNPGNQVNTHFWILADRQDPQIVYVGGDRGIDALPGQGRNFLRSRVDCGMVARGDARRPRAAAGATLSPQWVHLVGSNQIPQIPTGGTANGTQPHADHRSGMMDAAGNLLDASDGGVFRNVRPRDNQGDWTGISGTLQVSEFHDVAYDQLGHVVLGGAQDNGASSQQQPGGLAWRILALGDGGDVQVDATSTPGRSLRYASSQNLGGFRSTMFDPNNRNLGNSPRPALNVVQGAPLGRQFVTPVALNAVDPTRIAFGGSNGVYESLDRGGNISQVMGARSANSGTSVIYGHRQDTSLLVAASNNVVLVRRGQTAPLTPTAAPFPGNRVVDLVVDPANLAVIFATDEAANVYRTTDAGASWQQITGNLRDFGAGRLGAIEFIEARGGDRLVVGTNAGVFVALEDGFDRWMRLGAGLPNAQVFDMVYNPADDVLVVGTIGRGSFLLRQAGTLAIAPMP